MSWAWELVRGSSINPSSLKFAALQNKENVAENELFKPDRPQPQSLSVHTEDLVLLQDPFLFTTLKSANLNYYGPFEPDGVILKYWCRYNHIARLMKDYSFSNNFNRPVGHPILCEGPDFDGIKGGSIVTKINYEPDVLDYFYVQNPDEGLLGILETTGGFSIYLTFMLDEDPVQHNGEDPTILHHVDDTNGDYGTIVRVGENRELKLFVRDNGDTYDFITGNNKITKKTWYRVCLKYNPTGNVLGMRINNQVQTDDGTDSTIFDGSLNSLLQGITIQNFETEYKGRFVGRFGETRWYRNYLFSNGEMDNIWNNGRSISPIAYQQIAVAAHSRFNENVYAGGFDSTGYDSVGFDTT